MYKRHPLFLCNLHNEFPLFVPPQAEKSCFILALSLIKPSSERKGDRLRWKEPAQIAILQKVITLALSLIKPSSERKGDRLRWKEPAQIAISQKVITLALSLIKPSSERKGDRLRWKEPAQIAILQEIITLALSLSRFAPAPSRKEPTAAAETYLQPPLCNIFSLPCVKGGGIFARK